MTGATHGRVLGIDLGSRRVGLALSDPSRTIASPLQVLQRSTSLAQDHRALAGIIAEWEVNAVVVGLPLSLNGKDGPAARAARAEVDTMRSAFGDEIAVMLYDERLTTISAQRSLNEAGVRGRAQEMMVDKVAAAVMLQAFLDGQSFKGVSGER